MNQLLCNHELAKQNASRASGPQNRETCFDLVGHHARRIAQMRPVCGVAVYDRLDDQDRPDRLR